MKAGNLRMLVVRPALVVVLAGAIVAGGPASAARGQSQVAKLLASDGAPIDWFGATVSISGDTVVIGAERHDDTGTDSGSAYIYQRDYAGTDNWGQVVKLTASDPAADDRFGSSVSISGDAVVIGAGRDDDAGSESGSAYIFYRDEGGTDNWGQVAKLTASDAATGDYFGSSVSISGDTVVIGAYLDDGGGSAYIFQRDQGGADNWGQVAKLTAWDAAPGDDFGLSVSISGDTVVAGAYQDDDAGERSGSAYVFQRDEVDPNNWDQVAKLTALDAAAYDKFGYSVSISGDTVVVGAHNDTHAVNGAGSAYVFGRNQGGADNWGQVAKLTASDAAYSDDFGCAVSISGDTVVAGAYGDGYGESMSGSAYVFQRDGGDPNNWDQVAKLTASDAAARHFFGQAVSISGDTALIGAYGNEDAGDNSGSAYTFDRDEGGTDNWGEVAKLNALEGAASDYFGYAVSISGDTALIGAYGDDDAGTSSGSAYIFQRDQYGAGNWGQVVKLTASDAAIFDSFGFSVSINGDTAVVGAYGANGAVANSGAAYIFQPDGVDPNIWGQVAKLIASDALTGDDVGRPVSISGDIAVIGARLHDGAGSNAGAAYVFYRDYPVADYWGQVAKLTASDAAPDDNFGSSLSISGDTVVVGAPRDDDAGGESGSAYVFYRNQGGANAWGQVAKLTALDAAAGDWFGHAVSISGDTVVIGSYRDDDAGTNSGSAYVFGRNQGGADNWGQVAKLTALDAAGYDYFGRSVSISGDAAVIGSFWDDAAGSNSGSAYVFGRHRGGTDNWGQVAKLTASDGAANDEFGFSVSINGYSTVIGARYDDDAGSASGSAYVFGLGCSLTLLYKNPDMGRVLLDPEPNDANAPVMYLAGMTVTLTAEPNENKQFKKWKIWDAVDPNITVIDTNNPITIDMVADRQVKAFFDCGGGGAGQALPLLTAFGALGLLALTRRRA